MSDFQTLGARITSPITLSIETDTVKILMGEMDAEMKQEIASTEPGVIRPSQDGRRTVVYTKQNGEWKAMGVCQKLQITVSVDAPTVVSYEYVEIFKGNFPGEKPAQ